jgi:RNA polymerase sigma-70 factor (ECF subfamily)
LLLPFALSLLPFNKIGFVFSNRVKGAEAQRVKGTEENNPQKSNGPEQIVITLCLCAFATLYLSQLFSILHSKFPVRDGLRHCFYIFYDRLLKKAGLFQKNLRETAFFNHRFRRFSWILNHEETQIINNQCNKCLVFCLFALFLSFPAFFPAKYKKFYFFSKISNFVINILPARNAVNNRRNVCKCYGIKKGAKMDQSSKQPLDENSGLMLKADDGDFEAYKRLYQRFAPVLKQFFIKRGVDSDLAEDLVQKIFTSLWQQRQNYPLDSFFEAYLYSMARNTLYSEIRRSRRMPKIKSIKHNEIRTYTHKILSQPEDELYLQEFKEALEEAKTKLTNEQFQALQIAQVPDIDFYRALEKLIKAT